MKSLLGMGKEGDRKLQSELNTKFEILLWNNGSKCDPECKCACDMEWMWKLLSSEK